MENIKGILFLMLYMTNMQQISLSGSTIGLLLMLTENSMRMWICGSARKWMENRQKPVTQLAETVILACDNLLIFAQFPFSTINYFWFCHEKMCCDNFL